MTVLRPASTTPAEDAGRALRYFEMAGEHATDAFANEEAISSFRARLAVTGRWHAKRASSDRYRAGQMDGTDEYATSSLDLDALAVSDRFRDEAE